AVAAETELPPEPPMVLTHCKAGAESAPSASEDIARLAITNKSFFNGLLSGRMGAVQRESRTKDLGATGKRPMRVISVSQSQRSFLKTASCGRGSVTGRKRFVASRKLRRTMGIFDEAAETPGGLPGG